MQPNRKSEVERHLHQAVHHALERNPYFLAQGLCVELHDNDVILSGVLGSYFHKQMAQESVRLIDGVRRVLNEIQVIQA